MYSRKPVLSAESEAKAKAIAEKNGALVAKMDFRIVRMTSSVVANSPGDFNTSDALNRN